MFIFKIELLITIEMIQEHILLYLNYELLYYFKIVSI